MGAGALKSARWEFSGCRVKRWRHWGTGTSQLWTRRLLLPPSFFEDCSVDVRRASVRDPSQRCGDTEDVSTASCTPPKSGNLSATISSLRGSRAFGTEISCPSPSCCTADASGGAFHCEPSSPQDPSSGTRCTMVAQGVKKTANRHVQTERERRQKKHTKQMRIESEQETCCCGENARPTNGPFCAEVHAHDLQTWHPSALEHLASLLQLPHVTTRGAEHPILGHPHRGMVVEPRLPELPRFKPRNACEFSCRSGSCHQ